LEFLEYAARRFARAYKKLKGNDLKALHSAMSKVLNDPHIGCEKVGDLQGVYVYKFRNQEKQFLLAYSFRTHPKSITWEGGGLHENFYNGLKAEES
jgi:mRNA-degrading endonuclease RelE of RelBE toxin-antitoxin system